MQKLRPDLDIGKNIQALRRKCGYTQEQVLAKMQPAGIPISKSSYAKIETNRLNIRVSELVALKNILKCGYDDFFLPCEAEMKKDLREPRKEKTKKPPRARPRPVKRSVAPARGGFALSCRFSRAVPSSWRWRLPCRRTRVSDRSR